jgi:hypothetical protein
MEIGDLLAKIQSVDFNKLVDECFTELMPEIIELNKDQLLGGLTAEGLMIRPKYTEDPYFKSRGQALGYARWKQKLEDSGQVPKPKKGTKYYTAPNLYIKGVFHGNILGKVVGEYLEVGAHGFGSDFDQKWKNIYGLTPENMEIIIPKLFIKITKKYRNAIGLN